MSGRALGVLVVLGLAVAAAPTAADPTPPPTLVLVTVSPPLRDAVATGLGPWHIPIVLLEADRGDVAALAATHHAAFVVIDRRDHLTLFDAVAGTTQRRPVTAPIDEPGAAALALTIKTWMRLGPGEPPAAPPVVQTAPAEPAPGPSPSRSLAVPHRLGVAVGVGVRGNLGGFQRAVRGLVVVDARVRWVDLVFTLELGDSVQATEAPVDWSQMSGSLRAGHTFPLGAGLWVRPAGGLVLIRGDASGFQGASGKVVHRTLSTVGLDGAVDLGWRRGRWRVAATAGLSRLSTDETFNGTLKLTVVPHAEPYLALTLGATAW